MAAARRGEGQLQTGEWLTHTGAPAGSRGGGGTEEGRTGELLVGGGVGGGGFTSFKAPGRSSGGVATVAVSSQEKQADEIKSRVVTSPPPAQLRILCYFIP